MSDQNKPPSSLLDQLEQLRSTADQIEGMEAQLEASRRALDEAERRYRDLTDHSGLAIFEDDRDGNITYCNDTFLDLIGYTREETDSLSFQSLVHPDDVASGLIGHRLRLHSGAPSSRYQCRCTHRSGKMLYFDIRVTAVFNDDAVAGFRSYVYDVSDWKSAEIALGASEANLASTLHAAPAGIGVVKDRVFSQVNDRFCTMVQYSPVELLGQSARMVYASDEEYERVGRLKYDQMSREGLGQIETQLVRKDGSTIDVLLSSAPMNREDLGAGITFSASDITEQKSVVRALEQAERDKSLILNATSEMFAYYDTDLLVRWANRAAGESVGTTPDELVGRHCYEIWHNSDSPCDNCPVLRARDSGHVQAGEITTPDGRIWYIRSYPVHGDDGVVQGMVELTQEITERKAADEELRRFKILAETANYGVAMTDLDGVFTYINESFAFMHGYAVEDLLGRTSDILLTGDSLADKPHLTDELLATGSLSQREVQLRRRDGSTYTALVNASLITDASGRPLSIASNCIDITSRKAATEALRESESRLRAIFDTARDVVFLKDRAGRYLMVNRIMLHHMNRKAADLIGRTDIEVFGTELGKCIMSNDARVLAGEVLELECDHFLNLRDRLFHVIAVPMRSDDGQITGLCGIGRDITERRRFEKELARADKLESIGLLAGGIAHDFNNIMTAVLGNIAYARSELVVSNELAAVLEAAESSAERARGLTRQLLTFSKGGSPVKESASVTELIRECAHFVLHGSNVRCELDTVDDLHGAVIDTGQISQVLNNLVINACQAMPDGGVVTIRAENVTADSVQDLPLHDQGYIRISVADQGIGIPKEHLGKIYDPFFTTKEEGNGLGLATAYSIVKSHDGHITCVSEPGRGTRFEVYLPTADEDIVPTRPQRPPAEPGPLRVLVMDDEEIVRDVAGRCLERRGHEVVLTRDGEEALARYREAIDSGRPFDAVILDLTIPGGMGGRETLRHLKEIDPAVRAIVCSGYSNETAQYEEAGFCAMVAKPFRPREIIDAVHRVVSEHTLAAAELRPAGRGNDAI